MFHDAFKKRRGIIPASGFYEWTEGEKKERIPHLFTATDGAPVISFAGLWDTWRNPETGETITSCTMIVSGASEWMTQYHDRMPILLEAKDFDRWLDGSMKKHELWPAAEAALRQWRVSQRVNKSGKCDDDPSIIEPELI
jgi:putative SOS response-associated peptidase YedK